MKRAYRCLLFVVLLIMAGGSLPITSGERENVDRTVFETRGTRTIWNGTLQINNDTHLVQLAKNYSWPGSGTETDPYVIANYAFIGSGLYSISINFTTLHIQITNCTIGEDENSTSNNPEYGIFLYYASNIAIDHCHINMEIMGIHAYYVHELEIQTCTIFSTCIREATYGIFTDHCTEVRIFGCVLRSLDKGIVSSNDQRIYVEENRIEKIRKEGVYLYFAQTTDISRNRIQAELYGVYTWNSWGMNLIENHISNCSGGGISCVNSFGTIRNNTITDSENFGIYAVKGEWNVMGNTISDCGSIGIELSTNSTQIEDNTITSCLGGGIDFSGGSSEIENNVITSCSRFGIGVRSRGTVSTRQVKIAGNLVANIKGIGIYLENSTSCSIKDNLIVKCSGFGIWTCGENDGDNLIHLNSFINNNNVSYFLDDDVIQATTSTSSNEWNGYNRGNFWSDLTIADENGDGIVDAQYPIIQDQSHDNYPLTYSPHIPGPLRIDSYEVKDERIRLNWTLPPTEYVGGSIRVYRGADRDDLQYVAILPGHATEFTEKTPIVEGNIFYMVSLETTWDCEIYSCPFEMEINLAPPEVEITGPVDGSYVNDPNLTISWKMYDEGSGLDHVEITLNDGEWINIGLLYEFDLYSLLSNVAIHPLEGHYSISVRVYDHIGLHSTDTIHLFLDMTDPVVSIISPEAGTYLKGSSFLVEWSSESDVSGISHYLVKMDEGKELRVEGNSIMYYYLEDGRHMISVVALDNAGNSERCYSHFYVDNTAPYLNMRTEFPGNYSASRNILLEWDAHDDLSGLDRLLLKVDNNMWIRPDGEGHHTVANLEEGLHLINILAYDNVGNFNDLLFSIKVDLKDPYINIHFPAHGELVTRSEDLKFGWVGMDTGSGISGYEVFLDDEPGVTTSLTHRSYDKLAQGNHTLRVVAIDEVGRRGDMTVEFSIDSIKPTAAMLTPVGYGVTLPCCIEIVFSEEMEKKTVRVWVNGEPGIINWLNGNWLKVWPHSDFELGTTYLVQISGGDLSGNYLVGTSFKFSTTNLGILKGKVVDSNGNPIPNCMIYIDEMTITSDLNGDFNLSLPSGAYTVIFKKPGFEDRSMEVEIKMGEERTLPAINLILQNEGKILNWRGYLNLLIALTLALIMISSIFMFIYYRRPRALEKEPPEMKEVMNSVRRFRPGSFNITRGPPRPKRSTAAPRVQPPIGKNDVYEKLGVTSEDLDAEIMNAYARLNCR